MPSKQRPFPRFRFSIRALLIIVALIGAYFGSWDATRRAAACLPASEDRLLSVPERGTCYIQEAASPMPFMIVCEELEADSAAIVVKRKRNYAWLFGPQIKLLFDSVLSYDNSAGFP